MSRTRLGGDSATQSPPRVALGKRKASSGKKDGDGDEGDTKVVDSSSSLELCDEESKKKKKFNWESVRVRARAATLMFVAFMGIVSAGHMYVWILVMLLQGLAFREVVNVRYREYKMQMDVQMPLFRTTQWLWYGLAMMFVYGDFVKAFAETHSSAAWLVPYARNHSVATFVLYCVIFMISVGTLKKDSVKYQVGQLSWTIVTLCIVVGQMKFVANNIFDGLYWFVFPVWLVINNDCWAWFWGILLGRKLVKAPFFVLSPKKTWEGFVGAAVSTVAVAYYSAPYFAALPLFTCPATKLTFVPSFLQEEEEDTAAACNPGDFFTKTLDRVAVFGDRLVLKDVYPAQLHAVVFALFASVVSPFGGFLASAIKRAYHVKDFDSIIPGHGGVTDRVDCEFLISLFIYVYKKTFIRKFDLEWHKVFALSQLLSTEHRLALYHSLEASLLRDGVLIQGANTAASSSR